MNIKGIDYTLPKVTLLQESGIGVAELAARTCYDSFENSENECVVEFPTEHGTQEVNEIESSELLDSLAWVHHHHSIIEHSTLSFLVKGTSRGVLQEHARHRLQNISVRSTRYTMSSVINAFVASKAINGSYKSWFVGRCLEMDMLVTADVKYYQIEFYGIWEKLNYQYILLGEEEFRKMTVAKSSLVYFNDSLTPDELFGALQIGAKKRNAGDNLKHIVTDNWKVDMVVTFNLRSLKNYFDLRSSGAAWFQIQWLAEAMKEATPVKYLQFIDKNFKRT